MQQAVSSHRTLSPCAARAQSVTCVINGSARSHAASEARERVVELFRLHGREVDVVLAENGSDIPGIVRRAISEHCAVVVAAGGDGTVNAVASVVMGSHAALGVLPLGTLNHFAKDLGIPMDLEEAVETVITGSTVNVDVGKVNGKIFLNNSSLGLYPAIVRQREGFQKKGHGKWWAFAVATVQVLRRYQRLYVRWKVESQPEVSEETPFVFIGNNQYEVCGLRIGERDCINAGKLWVYRAPQANRSSLLRLAIDALRGKLDTRELAAFATDTFSIRTQKNHVHVATDGEVHTMQGTLQYSIVPKVLSVIVPQTRVSKPG